MHWTQTPEGRERMRKIALKKKGKKYNKSKAEVVISKIVKSKPKKSEIDVNLFMELIKRML